jgi:hypothetical protein
MSATLGIRPTSTSVSGRLMVCVASYSKQFDQSTSYNDFDFVSRGEPYVK